MKYLIPTLLLALSLTACSTCYECYEQVPQIDANTGDTIGYSPNTAAFCTADPNEVSEREAEGAVCEVQ